MIIRIQPRVCDGLIDREKCKVILQYCNPNDTHETCTVKMLTHATFNGENLTDFANLSESAYNLGTSTIDFFRSTAYHVYDGVTTGTTIWYNNVEGTPAKIVIGGTKIALEIIGMGVSSLLGGG